MAHGDAISPRGDMLKHRVPLFRGRTRMPSRGTLLSKLRRHAGRSAVFGTLLSMAFSAAAEEVDFATAENGPAPAAFDTRMRTGGGRGGRRGGGSRETTRG